MGINNIITRIGYQVPEDHYHYSWMGIRYTTNQECRNMSSKEAIEHSKTLFNCVFDEKLKECLIFTYVEVGAGEEYDWEFCEVKYEDLIEECIKIELIIA